MSLMNIKSLTIDERLEARAAARSTIVKAAGDRPDRSHYEHYSASKYPGWVIRLVTAAMIIVFLAAAAPSLFRLFTAGRDYFLHGISDPNQAAWAGAATFVLAEFLVIVSTLAMRVYFTGKAQLVMVIPIAFGVLMALVGNWVIAQPADLFGWLETLAPPVAVLFMSLIGEKLILTAIEQRQQNEQAYQIALADWQVKTSDPENSAAWRQFYATALRESLIRKNQRYKAGKEAIPMLSTADWKALVYREMQADNWYEQPDDGSAVMALPDAAAPVVEADEMHPFGSSALTLVAPVSMSMNGHAKEPGGVGIGAS